MQNGMQNFSHARHKYSSHSLCHTIRYHKWTSECLSRAFDTMPHEKLMGKLAHYHMESKATVGHATVEQSLPDQMDNVGPQGTTMGPLLYQWPPEQCISRHQCMTFVDDCLVHWDITFEHHWSLQWRSYFIPHFLMDVLLIDAGVPFTNMD